MRRAPADDADRPLSEINRLLLVPQRRNGADGAHYARATLKARRTRRQRIKELARRHTDAEIAAKLGITEAQVRWYRGL